QASGGAPAAQATVSGSGGDWWPGDTPFGVSELRGGFGDHDSGVFGRNEEDGQVVTIEARFAPFTGGLWDKIWQPRPHLGVNINTEGDTSSLYFGLTWDWDIWRAAFVSFDLGGAVHDGELTTSRLDRKELGSRILFREALELGYVFGNRHALSLRLDHISNANLADQNEALETIALIYGYRFP
ncbi:MAG: acyloxyacyl hydrolase, partial [Alphaproteobacteria bacterium]